MSPRGHRLFSALEMVVLLLPLTALCALMTIMFYAAYPIPFHPLQLMFDLAMLLVLVALLAAWRLAFAGMRGGPDAVRRMHPAWAHLPGLGVLLGLVGAAIGLWHGLNPQRAPEVVGFILLAPALALLPVWLHVRRL